ncbi:hypothetical protein GCM10022297_13040 [Lactobacillus hamsteri]|uniref:Uncharacterized protein n=1 Tax=Lactobacillus hamsteri DSM 5661 = JCM 6256 TaxID=1423754 RepID=A0A0R1YE35_9LACO|nr:hypothetical protein [Lactobacillus hamsteri]KRM40577.1 hypothetical protein FC39_GL000392 [Lactobacillus hamsteri DSM 5661 = JCM 6256]
MKKKVLAIIFALFIALGVGISTGKAAYAAPYGAKLYTTPKALRGTWHFKNGKTVTSGLSSKYLHAYSKIRITKHQITFTRRAGKKALSGTYTFYEPKGHYTEKNMMAAEKYANKHKWLAPTDHGKKSLSFRHNWLHQFGESATGELSVINSKNMRFANLYVRDYFRK